MAFIVILDEKNIKHQGKWIFNFVNFLFLFSLIDIIK
jgi:hypothetical protein